eukprot:11180725-Alexandrium_andersonii.AAC.1
MAERRHKTAPGRQRVARKMAHWADEDLLLSLWCRGHGRRSGGLRWASADGASLPRVRPLLSHTIVFIPAGSRHDCATAICRPLPSFQSTSPAWK